jgi:hypothetical protein
LHVGAQVKFTTTQQQGAGAVNASQVTYDPAGTGAVAESVQTKLRQTVNVVDYGAVGDGVANDTAAIQAAINQAALSSGIVCFPVGTFNITSPLDLKGKYITLCGAGMKTTIIKAVSAVSTMFDIYEVSDVVLSPFVISNLTLDGNTNAAIGIKLQYRHNFVIENVYVSGCNDGIVETNSWLGLHENVRIASNNNGLILSGSNHSSKFDKIDIVGASVFGLTINPGLDGNLALLFSNCTISFGTGGAVYMKGTSATFDTCYIGENISGIIFQVEAGITSIIGGYVNYGYAATSIGFALTYGVEVFVQNTFILSQGLDISSLIFAPATGSPADSGKISFQNILMDTSVTGNTYWTGDVLAFGSSQPVFSTRYGRNYTSAFTDCTGTDTAAYNERTITVSSVTGASPVARLSVALTNTSERFIGAYNRYYLSVVYKSNKQVSVFMSSGAGKVAPFKLVGVLPATTSLSGQYATFIQLNDDNFDAAYTYLEFLIEPAAATDSFTLREVYFADDRMLGYAPGRTSTNLYKC